MPRIIYTTHTRATVRNIAQRLTEIAERLRAEAAAMEADGIETLEVTHQDSLLKGMRFLESWSVALYDARRREHEARGYYHASEPPPPPKKPRRRSS